MLTDTAVVSGMVTDRADVGLCGGKVKHIFLWIALLSSWSVAASEPLARRPVWSHEAKLLKAADNGRYGEISAPWGGLTFQFTGDSYDFRNAHGEVVARLPDIVGSPDLVEIGWSPNGAAVFVNASDGGSMGTWRAKVFVLKGEKLMEVLISPLVERASVVPSNCKPKNIGIAGWVIASREVLVLEEVPSTSRCENMGKVVGYLVDIERLKIVESLNPAQIRKRFGSLLGAQARAAVR